ncbi:MAG TPA: hypothetical protein VGI78_27885 [Acetobacteraceae bacterium]
MSDSISTPANTPAPAPAVIPGGGGTDTGPRDGSAIPPARDQPGLSISEAGRLLNQQRRAAQGTPQRAEAPARVEAPNRTQAPPAAPTEAPAATPAAPTGDAALDTMARALGLPEGVAPQVPGDAPDAGTPAIEIDGRRFTADQVRRAMAAATDYTQKTQALARERQALQQQQEALATVLPYIQPELARVQQQLQGVARPDPTLIDTNPQEYLRQRAAFEAAADEQGRMGTLTQLQQQAMERALSEQVSRSNEALAKEFPDWGDPQKRGEWQQRIATWAMDTGGFQKQELARLSDHRQLKVMMKAMMFDALKEGAVTRAPQQQRPARGSAPPPAPAAAVSSAEQAFEARPNIRNAANLLTAQRAAARR